MTGPNMSQEYSINSLKKQVNCPKKILVVDDNSFCLETVTNELNKAGIPFEKAHNG